MTAGGPGPVGHGIKVIADISMSLDGYVTGPAPDIHHGLGLGADALHTWATTSGRLEESTGRTRPATFRCRSKH